MLTIDKISSGVRTAAMEYPIKKVDLFGSYADRKSNERSDVDLIVEFKNPDVSLFTISGLQIRLEELLGTDVDIIHGPIEKDSMIEVNKVVSIL